MFTRQWLYLIFFILLILASCAPTQEIKKENPDVAVSKKEIPRIVAILPFQNETEEWGIANTVRKAFYNHFSSKPYRDIELSVVDEKTVHLEKSTGKTILELSPAEICKSMDCEGLIYGKVTDYKKVYAALYSQLSIEAEVWMVNIKTGKEVFRIKDSVKYHEGSFPLSPLGAIMTAVSTAMNLREIQQVRLINELAYKFNEKIPSPEGIMANDRPLIKEILTNVKEGPFGKGELIRVGLDGEHGAVATFDIGNFKKGILMKEAESGIYIGDYLVMPGDNASDMPVIAYLKRPGGLESQWIDVSGFVTIDTTPPSQIKNVRAKGFQDRIEILWDAIKDTPDLKGYIVLRSEQPLSGYSEIARVELNAFEDRTVQPDTVYFYRVLGFDHAENESEIHDPVKACLIPKEPVILTEKIQKDTVLSGGTYLIKESLIIPKGLSLTIDPETRMMFEEDSSLYIYGKMIVNGKDSPVEFIPSGDKKWKGIIAEGGNIVFNGFRIKGALTAMLLKDTEGFVENGVITGNDLGISISGIPSVTIKGSSVSGNRTGIELQKTDVNIIQNNIFQNLDGIIIKGCSGEIKDNNIFDNNRNISSDTITKIGANYIGSLNIEDMKISGINLTKIYDNKFPDGKIVDPVSNPYAALSHEDRQQKATELLIEAGNYFRQRNYGKASALFEETIKASPSAEAYYYLAVCYQEMKDDEKALRFLKEGAEKFSKDSALIKALGLMYYQKGDETEAKKAFEEVIRLNPEDRQVKFLLERIER
ncbi:MAG: GNA1162 family protein [Nitrospirota bacterium]